MTETKTLYGGKVTVEDNKRFEEIFKAPLYQFVEKLGHGKYSFYHFDVIKFDEFVKTPDGISCKEHVNFKYGKEGQELMFRLLMGVH
jgi:hypothetical protein